MSDSLIDIANGYGLDVPGSITVRDKILMFSTVGTGSGVYPAFYAISTERCFLGGKVAGAGS
jgi:hypothetical protein